MASVNKNTLFRLVATIDKLAARIASTQELEARVREAREAISAKIIPEDGHDPESAWDSGRYSAFKEAETILRATLTKESPTNVG